MRSPVKIIHPTPGAPLRWERPDREWLEREYRLPPRGLGKAIGTIAQEVGANFLTVRRWIKDAGIYEPHSERHPQRIGGELHPNFNGGMNRQAHRKTLGRLRPSKCDWCGMLPQEDARHNMHVHHVDHDIANGDPANLMWLCYHCNLLEAQLWNLQQKGRVRWRWRDGKLVVVFVRKRSSGPRGGPGTSSPTGNGSPASIASRRGG